MNRIAELRKRKKLTQVELCQRVNITQASLSGWERGRHEPDYDTLKMLAEFFGVSTDYLLGRTDVERPTFDLEKAGILPLPEMENIPLIGTIACGTPIYAEQNIEDYIKGPVSAHASFALRCQGDSMINARIFDGDIVFIRQQETVDDGEIAAVLIGEEATLKRVRQLPGKLVLSPCNPMFDDLVFTGEELEEVRILGKAVYFVSQVR